MINNSNPPLLYGSFVDRWLRIGGQLEPYSDNGNTLGSSTRRWTAVYAVNGTIQTSDARFKTNIIGLTYGLESILRLKPVSFIWKESSDSRTHLGLIAQDVEKVIGEVIDKGNDSLQTLGINYSELVPVLIRGMQEQQQQIESQNQKIDRLEKMISEMKMEIASSR